MSQNLDSELRALLTSSKSSEDGSYVFEFSYPMLFRGFAGHFPSNPILPGVCLLQSVRIGLERALKRAFRIRSISHARFAAPVQPNDHVAFHLQPLQRNSSTLFIKAIAKRGEKRIADFSLTLTPLDKEVAG